ncbi:MAG TPA: type I restriction enzyme HsdR N-terminal domain-containing protein [Desulfobacterales bacterium]|nr:type I restriction enzyme HsdR N-terminal domain-containing protein [Desulfobacterales bacterium]
MTGTLKPFTTLTDYATGRTVPNIGAEENRQAVERVLVDAKGFAKTDIEVGAVIVLPIQGESYRSRLDLVVRVDGSAVMVVTCAAGALGSWERQTLAAARLIEPLPAAVAVVSDGREASVLEALSGKRLGDSLDAIPSKSDARRILRSAGREPFPPERRERESLIFRTYDLERVNRV